MCSYKSFCSSIRRLRNTTPLTNIGCFECPGMMLGGMGEVSDVYWADVWGGFRDVFGSLFEGC